MIYYEGLVVPRKNNSRPKAATRVMQVQFRVFCFRTDKSVGSDCLNISCDACLFNEGNNTDTFNKWYSEMKDTFEKRHRDAGSSIG